jgi:hypothetical protein
MNIVNSSLLYGRNEHPFDESWEKWAARWCNWMLSIPNKNNPSIDTTGRYCSMNQNDMNVWFLTGTFGNIDSVKRKCTIPYKRSIFFPILEKEDSFAEDIDLREESELIMRCVDSMNRVTHLEAYIDGQVVENLEDYRVLSEVFDLNFPEGNVYSVRPGITRSVCDGYWLFIKPLKSGKHCIDFMGETLLLEGDAVTEQLKADEVYKQIWGHINNKSTFRLDVSYDITIADV